MNLIPFSIGLLKDHWKLALFALLALFATIQTFRLQSTQGALQAEKHGRRADRAEYARAQADAAAIALTAKIEKEAEYAAKADEADRNADALSERYRLAVLRIAAAQRSGRTTDMPRPAEASGIVDGPGAAAIVPLGNILIPEADVMICAVNQARLEAAHDWAVGLSYDEISAAIDSTDQ